MAFDRLFDADTEAEEGDGPARDGSIDEDVASLRQAISDVGSLPADQRRFLTGYAYVLVRIARVDSELSDIEIERIEEAVIAAGGLSETEGALLVGIASRMSQLFGATEDYAFTREFARTSSPQHRQRLMRACVTVAAAGGRMGPAESSELHEIGRELGFAADEVEAIRDQIDPAAGRAAPS